MKNFIKFLICLLVLVAIYAYREPIINNIYSFIDSIRKPKYIETNNLYSKNKEFNYVKINEDLTPHSYQDILNILYTSLDKRYSNIIFYCPLEYTNCLDDVATFADTGNRDNLTIIGNMVNPYNNFTNISVLYDTTGKVELDINYLYDDDMVRETENFIDEILRDTISDDMSTTDKMKVLHDYLTNYAEYDSQYEEELKTKNKTTYQSNTAYGLYKNRLAICSGYADTYALLLDRIGVDNFKIASDTHIWNVVKLDNKYYHIDVTWDDPTNNIFKTPVDKYFMIDTQTILEYDKESHNFNINYYSELK